MKTIASYVVSIIMLRDFLWFFGSDSPKEVFFN